jgi:4'-phosphopantetheinyl transferase
MSPNLFAFSRPTARVLEAMGSHGDLLTEPEQDRMSRLRLRSDRDDFLAAHLLVRACAAQVLGVPISEIAIVQRCPTCGGPHGRPEVLGHPEVGASLAHSQGVVAAAAGLVPLGIDVEAFPSSRDVPVGELSVVLTAAETAAIEAASDPRRAVLLSWARKEACLKAGLVDLDGLGGFDLSGLPLDAPPEDVAAPRSLPHGGWAVHDWWDRSAGAIGVVVAPAGAEMILAGD